MNDEMELFRQQLQDIVPLEQDSYTPLSQIMQPTPAQLAKRAAAVDEHYDELLNLSDEQTPQLKPDDLISYQQAGIQHGVFKKLRLGKYAIEDRIDLHKLQIEQAKQQLVRFIHSSQHQGYRCILVIHGKGQHGNPPARMKSYVSHWLPQLKEVLALHSAQPYHGGYGAIYVLLRKNIEQKIDTRERHARHLS